MEKYFSASLPSVLFNLQGLAGVFVQIPLPGSRTCIISAQLLGKDQRKILLPSEFLLGTFPSAGTVALPYAYSEAGYPPCSRDRTYFLASLLFTYSLSSRHPGEHEKKVSKVQMGEHVACHVKEVSSPSSSNSLETKAVTTHARSCLSVI